MTLESEALLLQRAVQAKVLNPDKGAAALSVYAQLRQKGAQFTFGDFLINQGLLTGMALAALEQSAEQSVLAVSTLGDYQLLELIGEGQNGVVFKALQKSLDRIVALKILNAHITGDANKLERFQNEARATARLMHPNIVMCIAIGSEQGLHYFAMEYMDGGSLRAVINTYHGTIHENIALNLTLQIATGLQAAHAVGLLHRDVKPDNILLTSGGQAKLGDLGISQILASERAVGDFWASPPYAAPEVIRGLAEDDPRSDIYSLGVTCFEMFTGQPPYCGATPEETLGMHLHNPVPDARSLRPDLSAPIAELINKMLAKEMNSRLPDAAAILSAISKIMIAPPSTTPSLSQSRMMPKTTTQMRPSRLALRAENKRALRSRYSARRLRRGR